MKDDRLYLIHIGECMDRIERYTSGGKENFFEDSKTQDAVIRNLQMLAESSQRLSETLKNSNTDIDWRGIGGFRNILVHDYLGINLDRVWKIVESELPLLRRKIDLVLKNQKQ